MPWPLFLIVPTGFAKASLRRYRSSRLDAQGNRVEEPKCPTSGFGYHNAETAFGGAQVTDNQNGSYRIDPPEAPPRDDPRWPTTCACGYVFQAEDEWQVFTDRLYRPEPDDGRRFGLLRAPAGALWRAPWFEGHAGDRWCDAQGRCLVVKLPDGFDWVVTGPSTNGDGWTLTGEIPALTARPSILSPGYHGFLTDGVLSDDLEGRSYGAAA